MLLFGLSIVILIYTCKCMHCMNMSRHRYRRLIRLTRFCICPYRAIGRQWIYLETSISFVIIAFPDATIGYRLLALLASLSFGINLMLAKAIKRCWLCLTFFHFYHFDSEKGEINGGVNLDSNLDMSMRGRSNTKPRTKLEFKFSPLLFNEPRTR